MWRKTRKQQSPAKPASALFHSEAGSAGAAEPSWPPTWNSRSQSPYDQLEEITKHLKACITEITKMREERDYSNARGDMTGGQ